MDGFKDKSAVVRRAPEQLQKELEHQALEESAELYAQEYQVDEDLRALTEAGVAEWPG